MKNVEKFDWREVAARFRVGDYQYHDYTVNLVFQGPIKSVIVNDEGIVIITLEWVAQKSLLLQASNRWERAPDDKKTICFPNNFVAFIIVESSMTGPYVYCDFTTIHLDSNHGLDPQLVIGLPSLVSTR